MSFDDELGNVAAYDPGDPDYEPGTGYGNCSGCGDWHRPPWCADVDDLDVAQHGGEEL